MTGNSLIGNTSQFMIDATGKRVVLDLEHCVCCDQTVIDPPHGWCGPCTESLPDDLTADIGLEDVIDDPNFLDTWPMSSGTSYCDTPCADFGGEYTVSRTVSNCGWLFEETLCNIEGMLDALDPFRVTYFFRITANIKFNLAGWVMFATLLLWAETERDQGGGFVPGFDKPSWWANYQKVIAAPCTAQTLVLDFVNEGNTTPNILTDHRPLAFPCRDLDESIIEWPATISVIIP